ncbi:hypothetical protein IU459_26925, partial [Nocardia amamiensis]
DIRHTGLTSNPIMRHHHHTARDQTTRSHTRGKPVVPSPWQATALLIAAPGAAAYGGTDDILGSFLDGFADAFGSSSSKPPPRSQSTIYPDSASCNREAARLRRPGVIAECNPLGGTSGQYQLIVMTR